MLIDLAEKRRKSQRTHALSDAYAWGERAKVNGRSLEIEWAVFLAQYGIDPEAQRQFVAGYQNAATF